MPTNDVGMFSYDLIFISNLKNIFEEEGLSVFFNHKEGFLYESEGCEAIIKEIKNTKPKYSYFHYTGYSVFFYHARAKLLYSRLGKPIHEKKSG